MGIAFTLGSHHDGWEEGAGFRESLRRVEFDVAAVVGHFGLREIHIFRVRLRSVEVPFGEDQLATENVS